MPRNASSTATTPTKSPRRSAPKKSAAQNVIRSLTDDHKKVKKMFAEFMKLKKKGGAEDEKQLIVETVCAELTIHAQLEEELLYPAARTALEEADLVNEAEVEHSCAKQLISELSVMQSSDPLYDAKFIVLCEYVAHHVEEEEQEMFPKLKSSDIDIADMAIEMEERRMTLRDELGFMSEETPKASTAKSKKKVH